MLVLHQGDRLQSAADHTAHTIVHDLLGGSCHRHQAGGALPIHGHTRGRHRQAGAQRDLARHVGAGGALLQRTAHDHVLDTGGIDTGAPDGFRHRGGAKGGAPEVVKTAAKGLADRGTGGSYNNCFSHGRCSPLGDAPGRPLIRCLLVEAQACHRVTGHLHGLLKTGLWLILTCG